MKQSLIIITIIALIISLSSCGLTEKASDSTTPPSGQDAVTNIDNASENAQETVESIRVTGSLHDSEILEYGAKTSFGYYEIISWPFDMYSDDNIYEHHGNIVFTDYATGKRMFLCNVPGCSHNDSNCTSYVDYYQEAVLFTNYSETKLYLVSKGIPIHQYETEEQLPSITEMDLDGSNRRLVCRLQSNEHFALSNKEIASDQNVYLSVTRVTKANDDVIVQDILARISLIDGSRTDLISDEDWGINRSTWDDEYIITYRSQNDDNTVWFDKRDTNGTLLQTYGPYTGSVVYYSDKKIYVSKQEEKKGTLTIYNLENSSQRTITGIPCDTDGFVSCFGSTGQYIHWYFLESGQNGQSKKYLIDTSNDSFKEFTLHYTDTFGTRRMVAIIGKANDDNYFVQIGVEPSTLTLIDKTGISHTYDYHRPIRALMTYDDYINCVPNYKIIEDEV